VSRESLIDGLEFEEIISPNAANRIWLETRRKIDIWRRAQGYDFIGLGKILEGCSPEQSKERLDLLDLSYLDPLTGVEGQSYFLRKQEFFKNSGILVAVKSESIELINRKLGYAYGNLYLYVAAKRLKGRLKQVMRISSCGRKFLVIDDDWRVVNDLKLILARTCLRTSDGYEMKGIGVDISCENSLNKTWQDSINAKVFTIARMSEKVERCDIYEHGRLVEKIEGSLLHHILHLGE